MVQYHYTTENLLKLLVKLGIESAFEHVDDLEWEIRERLRPDPTCSCGYC